MKNCIKLSGRALISSLSLALILMGSNATMEVAFAQSPAMPTPPPANNSPVAVDKAKAEYDPTQPLIAPAPNAKVEAKESLKELEKDLRKDSQKESLKESTKEPATTAEKKSANSAPSSDLKSFLWEVKSATNTVYLFGTIHVGKRSFYPLPDAVEKALANSKMVVVEADITKTDGLADITALIMYSPPDTLQTKIPSALFDRLKVQLARYKIPVESVKPMKPFMVGALLSVTEFTRLGYEMNFGVDGYLIASAQKQMKPVLELESQLGQIQMLTEMPPLLQEAFLENALGALESNAIGDQVTGVVNAWQSGDTKLMQDVIADGNKSAKRIAEFDEILLYSRHPAMIKKIESYLLGAQPYFVAVGSLHLLGPKGLVELLRAKGYKVRQL
jgi:uncharacterized protein YbaP (TraB family)